MKLHDSEYMHRAIELAKQGEGWVNPNPLVGAVIVKDGRIIGEGYHERFGNPHAERNAIKSLMEDAAGATMYVTLEPCVHQGKQPPCTDAIIENKIARVVIGSSDPNPLVAGKGVAALRQAGIEVEENILKEKCDALNPVFFHYIQSKTPYVVMKYAMTMDGKIATKTGASKWITNETSRNYVQKMRHVYMGIMVGIETVLKDDPMLSCRRDVDRDPVRIICDSQLRIPLDCQIVQTAKKIDTILVCAKKELPVGQITEPKDSDGSVGQLLDAGLRILNLPGEDGRVDLVALMRTLGDEGIDSVLLEGGGTINESALRAGIVNEIRAFIAPKIFGGKAMTPVAGIGIEQPNEAFDFTFVSMEEMDGDLMLLYRAIED